MLLANGWDGVPPAQAGWLGLVVILALGIAVVFLYKSMNKHLRRMRDNFERSTAATKDRDETPP